jgi:hypothetical protein
VKAPGRDSLGYLGGSRVFGRGQLETNQGNEREKEADRMSILWIILIVILVLALLGFFSRGYW